MSFREPELIQRHQNDRAHNRGQKENKGQVQVGSILAKSRRSSTHHPLSPGLYVRMQQ